ncbi:heterokaryon incompatibility, partial [Macroventuria anomochaeta]
YAALSYVWGKELCTHQALLNSRHVTIGSNLDRALRHLREIAGERVSQERLLLWVDALCIRRNDVAERNQQVQLMDIDALQNIYSSAGDVIVWLGPER